MLKSLLKTVILGAVAIATVAVLDEDAQAGRRRNARYGDACCGYETGVRHHRNRGYDYQGCDNGCGVNYASPCGAPCHSPCGAYYGQPGPCQGGACGIQQPCNACGTTTTSAPVTGYEHSTARPTYHDETIPSTGEDKVLEKEYRNDQAAQDAYLRDQRQNNPNARGMTDAELLRQRDLQNQPQDSFQRTDRNLQNTDRAIRQDINRTVPDAVAPPAATPAPAPAPAPIVPPAVN